jgi:hypothetical protein
MCRRRTGSCRRPLLKLTLARTLVEILRQNTIERSAKATRGLLDIVCVENVDKEMPSTKGYRYGM